MYMESYFDGGLAQLIGWRILGFLVTTLTFGICYPWALCMVYGWQVNHTVIEGRRLQFHGRALSLFGHWIKWLLLTSSHSASIFFGYRFRWKNGRLKIRILPIR